MQNRKLRRYPKYNYIQNNGRVLSCVIGKGGLYIDDTF